MTFDAKQFLSSVSTSPGVYRMLDEEQNTLYVGKAKRLKARLASYFRGQLNTKTQAMVMHCLPAHKGYEVTAEVMASPRCVAVDQAENRLHVQKAVLMRLLGDGEA